MTLRRRCVAAIGTATLVLAVAGCGGDDDQTPVTAPISSGPTPSAAPSTTPAPSPTPSATATATRTPGKPTATPNAPLRCPDIVAVSTATSGAFNEQTAVSDEMCGYGRPGGSTSGSIQSEDAIGAKTLKAYRAAMRKADGKLDGVKAKIQDRRDFEPGAFLVTFTSKVSGSISSLVVPRPDGQFIIVSASRIKKGVLMTDIELAEQLARAYLDG